MKKVKELLLIAIIVFALAMIFLSCAKQTCPTYNGRNTIGQYSNTKAK